MASSNADSGALPSQRLDTNLQRDTSTASSARGGRGRRRNPRGKMPAQGFHDRGSGDGSSTGRSSPPGTRCADSSEVGPAAGGRRAHMQAGGAELHGHHDSSGPSGRPDDESYGRPARGGQRKRRGRHGDHPGAVASDDYPTSGHSERGRGGRGGRGGSSQRGRRDVRREPNQDHHHYQQQQQQRSDDRGSASAPTMADDASLNAHAREFVPTGRESAASASAPVHAAHPGEQQHSQADGMPGPAHAHSALDSHTAAGGGGAQPARRAAGRAGRGAPRQPKVNGRYDSRSEKPYWQQQQEQESLGHRKPFDRDSQSKSAPRRPGAQDSSKDSSDLAEGAAAELKSGSGSQAPTKAAARRPKPTIKVQATGSARADEIIQELASDSCECMVCCDVLERKDKVWSCYQCYRVFHLRCIQRWGRSEAARVQPPADGAAAGAECGAQSGWRCPSCRTIHEHIPTNYWCFCGNTDLSEVQRRHRDYSVTPHSCGDICGKQRAQKHCSHRCNQLCHPGPCPPCPAMVRLSCGCGRTTQTVRCSQAGRAPACDSACGRALPCGRHHCAAQCHDGPCDACKQQLEQTCYCGRSTRQHSCASSPLDASAATAAAGDSAAGSFSCKDPCHRPLSCGNHLCELPCHAGPCPACELSPEVVLTCHCGQTKLTELGEARESCMDPIPTCRLTCSKERTCGPLNEPHTCRLDCHEGPCRPCPARSERKCQCGKSKQKLACKELAGGKEILCERMCNAKRSCGRHRCNQRCCTDDSHVCMLVCGKRLQCGQHKCEELCHRGHCDRCWQTIFDELRCGCGSEVLYPPQPCGARPPACMRVCARVHPCAHEPRHCCHTEDTCPPCPVLVSKPCMGGHELRNSVPCHLDDVSCGRRCAKPLPCGEHACDRMCHRGACLEEGARCRQPCARPRRDCRHTCSAECHATSAAATAAAADCPELACYAAVVLSCACGRRSLEVTCAQASGKSVLLNSLRTSDLARHMSAVQSGSGCGSFSSGSKVEVTCDDVCAHEERIRKMAEALQLDGASAATANCSLSQFLIDKMKTEPAVVQSVDAQVSELVAAVLRMPPNSHKTASLAIMNRDNRRVVHEIAELYTCESQGIDAEPQRSVRVTAFSHSYRPAVPLSDLLRRIQSQAKPPPPVSGKPPPSSMAAAAAAAAAAATPGPVKLKSLRNEKIPDYFGDP